MSDRTESSVVMAASAARILEVIADFEAYPEWTGAVREVRVLSRFEDARPERVRFRLDAGAIRDTYSLTYDWQGLADDGTGTLSWTLAESAMLRALDGSYTLRPAGSGCQVSYALTVELSMPMLGMLRRKAEKYVIDTALNELKKRVEG